MPTPADEAVAARIVAVLTAPWVVGANVFTGPVRPEGHGIPHAVIFCLASGGPSPTPYLGGSTAPSFRAPRVQVRVRSNPGEYAVGVALARSVAAALDKAELAGYVACQLQQAEPIYLGMDDLEHHEWSINVALWLVS